MPTNLLCIHSHNFLGRVLISYLSEHQPSPTYTLVDTVSEEQTSDTIAQIVPYETFFSGEDVDVSFDLIIYNGLYESAEDAQLLTYLHNYQKLLEKAQREKVPLLLIIPLPQNSNDTQESGYLQSIIALTNTYLSQGGQAEILALGEIYGPGMDLSSKTTLCNLLSMALYNPALVIENRNSFTYYLFIDDAIHVISQELTSLHPGYYSCAGMRDISEASLALRIAEITGKHLIHKGRNDLIDRLKTLPNVLPNWKPETSIERGLELTLNWIKETGGPKQMQIHPISSDSITTQPIRNYVSQETHPSLSEEMTTIKNRFRSISEIKNRIEDQSIVHGSPPHFLQGMLSIFKKKPWRMHLNTRTKYVLIGIGVGVVILYFTLIAPIIFCGLAYTEITKLIGKYDQQSIDQLTQKTADLQSSSHLLSWVFSVTGQQARFENLQQTVNTLHAYALVEQTYSHYIQPLQRFEKDFIAQNSDTQKALASFPSQDESTLLENNLTISNSELNTYLPFFPGNVLTLKNHITKQKDTLSNIQAKYEFLPNLLGNTAKYIVIVSSGNNSMFTSTTTTMIFGLTFSNGIYTGTQIFPQPKNITDKVFTTYTHDIEAQYSDSFAGVIFIDNTAKQKLFSGVTPSPDIFAKTLFASTDAQAYIATGIANDDIQITTNNTTTTKNDIIKLLE